MRAIDDLMADHVPPNLSERVLDLLDRFHYDVAFYVEDEAMRREMPDYYGPRTLRQKAEAFLRELSE